MALKVGKIEVEDTYCEAFEAFDGLFSGMLVTAQDKKRPWKDRSI